ncbi:MAG: hypothetical protein WD342_04290 [Verrucomicrobiales bacterium]
MTAEVWFHAEDALFWHVRYTLKTFPSKDDNPYAYLAAGAGCVLCISAGIEAVVNVLLDEHSPIRAWDELRLGSKIESLHELKATEIDWSTGAPQQVARLIRVRNWLAHNKQRFLGLSGSGGGWVKDGVNKPPKIDIESELKKDSVEVTIHVLRAILGGLA